MTDSEKLAVIKENFEGWMDHLFENRQMLPPIEVKYAWQIALALDIKVQVFPSQDNESEAKARKAYDKAFDLVKKNTKEPKGN